MSKLWEIVAKINDELERTEGELSEDVENLYKDLATKTDNCVEVLKALEAAEAHHRALAEEQTLAARRAAKARERLRWYVLMQAKAKGGGLQGDAWAIKVSRCKPSLTVANEDILSREFKEVKQITSIRKDLILEAIKAGRFVEGVELSGGETIRITASSGMR